VAEPPNALTLLLTEISGPAIYDALAKGRCLTGEAFVDRPGVVKLIDSAIGNHKARGIEAGPTVGYDVIGVLLRAGFLNAQAQARLKSIRVSDSWRGRAGAAVQELWWRLRY
jgi:hypothetical protein